ncbi:Uncharacterised protein [Klebsiella pneumoniae]|uniref:hypothetical protein n=1 Tax=Klebsiella pneumoniae TaxID=573 RepID=UPI000E2D909D|nr:hypothetical protein [Klebsiella pneumoniae]SVL72172.1 Uncharacterised protein [Klebsiella pneumoniae]
MYKLKLNPQTSGYGVTPGDDVKRQQIDVKRNSHIVDVNWNLSKTDFNKMMAFWRIYQNKPASFYADLVIDQGTRQQYQCNFIPNSFKTNEVNGNLYRVNAQLEVVQNQPNLTADIALIKDWEV